MHPNATQPWTGDPPESEHVLVASDVETLTDDGKLTLCFDPSPGLRKDYRMALRAEGDGPLYMTTVASFVHSETFTIFTVTLEGVIEPAPVS